jgi:hypothetical protein
MCVNYSNAPVLGLAQEVPLSRILYVWRGTYMGTPTSSACCSAACRATRAPLCVSVGTAAVADAVGVMLKYVCSSNMESKEKEYKDR